MIRQARRRGVRPTASATALVLLAALVAACASATPSVAPAASEPAVAPSPVAGATPTPAATAEPTAEPTPSPEPTPEPTAEPTPSPGLVTGLPDPSDPPEVDLHGGETGRIRVPESRVVMTLPKAWQTIDLDGDGLQALLDAIPEGVIDPAFIDQLPALIASGVKVLAYDFQAANLGANLNVNVVPYPIPPSFLRTTAELGVSAIPSVSNARYDELTIDGTPSLRVDLVMTIGEGAFRSKLDMTMVYLAFDDETVVITVGVPRGGQKGDIDRIVRSIGVR